MAGKSKILKINISKISYQSALSAVLRKAIDRDSGFYCFANAHMAVESLSNKELEYGLRNKEAVILADGFPIAKSMKLIYGINQERIAGMDFLPGILKEAEKHSLKIFLFGSTESVLESVRGRIIKECPKLKIAGSVSPPRSTGLPIDRYAKMINNTNANIVIVALGCPKQEIWMSKNYMNIDAPLLGIGGALNVYSGELRRAPLWIQKIGFEWLFRLIQEPGRLWRRYLYTNTLFIVRIIKQWISIKLHRKDAV